MLPKTRGKSYLFDKTRLIYQLAKSGFGYFLSRPTSFWGAAVGFNFEISTRRKQICI
jgi:hypothetical protein